MIALITFIWLATGAMSLAYLAVKVLEKPLRAGADKDPLATLKAEVKGYISSKNIEDFVMIPNEGEKETPVEGNNWQYEAVVQDDTGRLWLTRAPFTLRDTAWLAQGTEVGKTGRKICWLPTVGEIIEVIPVTDSRVMRPEKIQTHEGISGFITKYFGYATILWTALTALLIVFLMVLMVVGVNKT